MGWRFSSQLRMSTLLSLYFFYFTSRVRCTVRTTSSSAFPSILAPTAIRRYMLRIWPNSFQYYRFHRDISLYVGNNTSESAYYPDREHEGCFSSYRFYEKRQDFSVSPFSRVDCRWKTQLASRSPTTAICSAWWFARTTTTAVITTTVSPRRWISPRNGGATRTSEWARRRAT